MNPEDWKVVIGAVLAVVAYAAVMFWLDFRRRK